MIAFLAGVTVETNRRIEEWAATGNPLYSGSMADLLSLLPFAAIALILWLVGREKLLRPTG